MKILFTSYDDVKNPNYGGGGAYAIHEIAKRLAKNHEVEVITWTYSKAKNEIIDNVFYKRIGFKFVGARLGQLFYHFFLPFYVVSKDFDVLLESFTPPFSTSFTPLFTRKPVMGLVHMLSAEDMERKYKIPFSLIERFGLRFYKRFIVLGDYYKRKILSVNKKAKVSVIPNGINLPLRKKRVKKHILFIGRIEINQKGLDLLLESCKKVLEDYDVTVVIAGSGVSSEIRKLRKIIKSLSLEKKVKYVGKVVGDKKKKLFEESLFVVIPSRFETFSTVFLEACSFELPVLCFDIPGLKWVPNKICFKVKAFDFEEFTSSFLELVRNSKLILELGKKAYRFSKNFDWEKIYKVYEREIFKCVGIQERKRDEFTKILNKLLKRNTSFYFISPHLDDAVLSAGGLISYLAKKANVFVVNVFTEGSKGPYTLSSYFNLLLNKKLDAKKLYLMRRKEDSLIFRKIGVKKFDLGFVEALYRRKKFLKFPLSFLGRILPEFLHLYPTYRFHIIGGKIAKDDYELLKDISLKIKSIVSKQKNVVVFCPNVSAKTHVDHLIVNKAVKRSFDKVFFWQDFPYTNKDFKNTFSRKRNFYVFFFNSRVKQSILNAYKSQLRSNFLKFRIPSNLEIFWV